MSEPGVVGETFAHAPTSGVVRAVERAAGRIDRRPDPLSWLVTPVLVLVLGPLLTGAITFLVVDSDVGYPALCRAAAADNRCEEVVLGMLARHAVAFLIGWLLLLALPWWRGLRRYRTAFAIFVVLILVAAPLRLLSTIDYQALVSR